MTRGERNEADGTAGLRLGRTDNGRRGPLVLPRETGRAQDFFRVGYGEGDREGMMRDVKLRDPLRRRPVAPMRAGERDRGRRRGRAGAGVKGVNVRLGEVSRRRQK